MVVVSQPISRGAAKDSASAPRLMPVRKSYHGLQPWRYSDSAPRLAQDHSEFHDIRRSDLPHSDGNIFRSFRRPLVSDFTQRTLATSPTAPVRLTGTTL